MLTCGTLGRVALPKFEGKHVEVHRTEKDKKKMPYFEKYVIDGNGKVDELAKAVAIFDERFMAKQSSRSEKKSTQPCSMQPAFTVWWKNGRVVKSSNRSQKRRGFSWIRKEK